MRIKKTNYYGSRCKNINNINNNNATIINSDTNKEISNANLQLEPDARNLEPSGHPAFRDPTTKGDNSLTNNNTINSNNNHNNNNIDNQNNNQNSRPYITDITPIYPNIDSTTNTTNNCPILLDVFVIGSNAQHQLERFFKLTNIHPHNKNNLKLILSTTAGQCQTNSQTQSTNSTSSYSSKKQAFETKGRVSELSMLDKTNRGGNNGASFITDVNDLSKNEFQRKPKSSAIISDGQNLVPKGEAKTTSLTSENKFDLETNSLLHHDDSGMMEIEKAPEEKQPARIVANYQAFQAQLREITVRLGEQTNQNTFDGQKFKQLSDEAKLPKLIAIYSTIIGTQQREMRTPNLRLQQEDGQQSDKIRLLELLGSVIQALRLNPVSLTDEMAELLSIICSHQLEGVCGAFQELIDSFGWCLETENRKTKDLFLETRPESLFTSVEQQTCCTHPTSNIRLVHIDKSSNKALGATIKNDGKRVVIGRVLSGGLAHKSGLLREGDEVLAVNGVPMLGKNINQVVELIEAMDGTLSLTIKGKDKIPSKDIALAGDSKKFGQSTDKITISSNENIDNSDTTNNKSKIFLRAFFDFEGQHDEFIPCKELGLSFRKGDILSVTDRSDDCWWQATRQQDDHQSRLAGLIPSTKNLTQRTKSKINNRNPHDVNSDHNKQQHKISPSQLDDDIENNNINFHAFNVITQENFDYLTELELNRNLDNDLHQEMDNDADDDDENYYQLTGSKKNLITKLFNCPSNAQLIISMSSYKGGRSSSSDKMKHQQQKPRNFHFLESKLRDLQMIGNNQVPFYEEVQLYYPNQADRRPIILIGPKMIGQRELVAKLVSEYPTRFATPISHTTRPKRAHERDGIDFHFVSRENFEADMKLGRFLESGQYKGQYYGTSWEALRSIVRSGKTCVHMINIPSIFNFRRSKSGSQLKPFFVFVRPDINEPAKLEQLVCLHANSSKALLVNELIRTILLEVKLVESHLLAFFDLVINISPDLERAYRELLLELDNVEREPQWIPKFWSLN